MLSSQLFKLLRVLDEKEMKAFGHYLKGMHPGKKRLHKVHAYLTKSHPNYGVPRMEKTKVMQWVFKGKTVKERALSNLYAQLNKMLEQFLAIKELQSNKPIQDFLLVHSYRKRQREDLFFRQIDVLSKRIEEEADSKGVGVHYFLKQHIVQHLKYHSSQSLAYLTDENNLSLQYAYLYSNQYHELLQLKYQTELINRKRLYTVPTEKVPALDNKYVLLSKLNNHRLQLHKHQIAANYLRLKEFFYDNFSVFDKEENTITYTYLNNFAVGELKKGEFSFQEDLLAINKFCISNRILSLKEDFPFIQFLNLIRSAILNQEYVWVEELLLEYEKTVENKNTLYLAKASYSFHKKDYEEVTTLLQSVTYDDIYLEWSAKCLCLRCYYLLDEPRDFTWNYYRAFAGLVERNKKTSKLFKEGYQNFFKYFRAIFLNKKKPEKILQEIETCKNLHCRPWLVKVIKDSINKKMNVT